LTVLVLDVSVAMAWHFEDEAAPETWAILDQLLEQGAVVPALWSLEVANVLALAERRGRSNPVATAAFLRQLRELPVTVDEETEKRALGETLALARSENLSAYDACYLELAMRLGLPLATTDRQLRGAAGRLGVKLLP
jgi:predicted nucleic acid-binding protein